MTTCLRPSFTFLVVAVWILAWTLQAAAVDAPAPRRHAMLVAVTAYDHAEMNRPALQFPEVDALAVGDFLEKHGYEVDALLGPAATQRAIREKLRGLASKGNQEGAVVVGFWGHGVEYDGSDESMFCPFDATVRKVTDSGGREILDDKGQPVLEPDPSSMVGMKEVLGALKTSGGGSRVLLADCCRNDPSAARGRAFGSSTKETDIPDRTIALFACSRDQKAFEDPEWGHGAFTKCLLDLLPSLAEGRGDAMGTIVGDLEERVADLVRRRTKGSKTQTIHKIEKGVARLRLANVKPARPTSLPGRKGEPEILESSIGMKLVRIQAGGPLGAPSSLPSERKFREFFIGQTEVTQGQWHRVTRGRPAFFGPDGGGASRIAAIDADSLPVESISWTEAIDFCRRLTELDRAAGRLPTGYSYRPPSATEWLAAAQVGGPAVNEADPTRMAWCVTNSTRHTHPVAGLAATAAGLHDILGNVDEWCSDQQPADEDGRLLRMVRGGSWLDDPKICTPTQVSWLDDDGRLNTCGLRVVLAPADPPDETP